MVITIELTKLICDISALSGPSGCEGGAALAVGELIKPFVSEIRVDALGNLIALRRTAAPNPKKLMIDAHIDEVGLVITGSSGEFLNFSTLGGVDLRSLPAREVVILTDPPVKDLLIKVK